MPDNALAQRQQSDSPLIGLTTIIIRHLATRDVPICITFYFTLMGLIISSVSIVLSGLYTLHREVLQARRRSL